MTDNREKLIPCNKLYVSVDAFIEKIAVRFFTLIFKECVGDQLFLNMFLCPSIDLLLLVQQRRTSSVRSRS